MLPSKCSQASLFMRVYRSTILRTRGVMQPKSRSFSSKPSEDDNTPLSFSKSKAASWSAKSSFGGNDNRDDTPWYQPFSISLSLGAILIWFCVLREENDIDKELGKSLYDRVDGLEKKQLELTLMHGSGKDVDRIAVQKRLDEINQMNK